MEIAIKTLFFFVCTPSDPAFRFSGTNESCVSTSYIPTTSDNCGLWSLDLGAGLAARPGLPCPLDLRSPACWACGHLEPLSARALLTAALRPLPPSLFPGTGGTSHCREATERRWGRQPGEDAGEHAQGLCPGRVCLGPGGPRPCLMWPQQKLPAWVSPLKPCVGGIRVTQAPSQLLAG